MNSLVTFNFKENQIRTEIIDGEPWFCLADCALALGIKNAATSVKLSEAGIGKTYIGVETGKKKDGTPAIQQVKATFINEPNLYRLIFRSNKPQAQAFADWVYSEVLPTIRRTGCYSAAPGVDMKALGGLVKRCCRASIKEYWVDFVSGKPETTAAVRQTLGWLLKGCLDSMLAENQSKNTLDKLNTYLPLSDEDMLRCLQMWYAGRNNRTIAELQSLFEENGLLRSKLAQIRKTAAE